MYKKMSGSVFSIFLAAFFAFIFTPKTWASVAGEVNKANDLYRQNQLEDSLKLYQDALAQDEQSAVVKYDLGTALYKKGDYVKALEYLQQAAQDKNLKIKPKAEYNLGNVLYKSGMQKANTNVDEAIKSLQQALGHYDQTVAVDPHDQDALFNQDFVKKEIERLKQEKQQQQQNQQQSQKQQQGQKNQQKQQQQNKQGQQNQQQQNQQKQQSQQQAESQAQKQQKAQEQAEESQKEIDRKQAEDMLEDYRENEEPKKLLNYMPQKIDNRPVLKDW